MRILLIGGSGQIGSEIHQSALSNHIECFSPSSSELDITDPASIESALAAYRPIDFIVNASAYTAVDKAEAEPALANKINRDGPRFLAEACSQHNIPLLHLSTDYVFNGRADIPYREEMATEPLGVYGASKAAGEEEIRRILPQHIILRTAWVFGAQGDNFVKTMLRLGQEHSQLKVVSDQTGCPTAATDIATTVITILTEMVVNPENRWGTYHYCSADSTNWAEFAEAIFNEASKIWPKYLVVRVTPIPSSKYPTKADRPQYSVLDCSKIEQKFAIRAPCWHTSLVENIPNILKHLE